MNKERMPHRRDRNASRCVDCLQPIPGLSAKTRGTTRDSRHVAAISEGKRQAPQRPIAKGQPDVPIVEIETHRLRLRPVRAEDLEVLAALGADSRVMDPLGGVLSRARQRRRSWTALGWSSHGATRSIILVCPKAILGEGTVSTALGGRMASLSPQPPRLRDFTR